MKTIYDLFKSHVDTEPQKVAVIYEDSQLSYFAVNEQVTNLCGYLQHLGLTAGQRIALFAPNGIEYPIILLACAHLGLGVVPLPISLKGDALITALKSTPVAAAIAWPTVSKVLLETNVVEKSSVITLHKAVADEISWSQVMSGVWPLQEIKEVDVSSPYILTMTSGSTGQPKPITLSQQCKINRAFLATIQYYQLNKTDKVLVATPLYHSLAQRGVLMPLMLGATTVILPKFNLQQWVKAIWLHRVSFLFAVSAQLESLLNNDVDIEQLASIRCLVSSSAVLNADSKKRLLAKLSCQFHECYGASEVGVVTDFSITTEPDKNGSVGKPLPFVDVKIVDEHRKPVASLGVGEITCKTSTAFSGYLKLPEATNAAYDDEGYFYTGDLGYLDSDGYLYYVGRKKEVISSGGINVYPQDIEAVIKKHPKVIECVAFACPEPQLGEIVKVVYEQVDDSDITRELRQICLNELTDYQQPRILEKIKELDRNQMGKVLRNDVKLKYQPH
ncbi:class I adenylate-forming enzyme family protein [Pseudoalteromonas xiamenensis]|uniref:class I adenylate-forming enzyme family protein n=1 Tax=Pseudoalteromonas xiamenensis TaxID=882626 RepID=UPI0035EAFF39